MVKIYHKMFVELWLNENHYRLIVGDLSRQRELNTDPKTVNQMEFVAQLKKLDNNGLAILNVCDKKSMFILSIFKK